MKTSNSHSATTRAPARLAAALALGGVAAWLGGCATEPESHVVSAPPPGTPVVTAAPATAVVAAPVATAGPNTLVVTQAPPAPQQEIVSARPSSDHVWVGGYWTWRNNRYEWVAGHWAVPPHSGATWIPPRWVPEGSAYRFYEGYWE